MIDWQDWQLKFKVLTIETDLWCLRKVMLKVLHLSIEIASIVRPFKSHILFTLNFNFYNILPIDQNNLDIWIHTIWRMLFSISDTSTCTVNMLLPWHTFHKACSLTYRKRRSFSSQSIQELQFASSKIHCDMKSLVTGSKLLIAIAYSIKVDFLSHGLWKINIVCTTLLKLSSSIITQIENKENKHPLNNRVWIVLHLLLKTV